MVENCVYRVNRNLKRILQALNLNRLNHLFRNGCKVWADSICINQTDNAVKSHQIKRMADIFKQATWVVVCDGESNIDRDEAIGFINGIQTAWQQINFRQYLQETFSHRGITVR